MRHLIYFLFTFIHSSLIYFPFLDSPFADVGDRVDIDDIGYTVKEFGITTTIFKRGDGKEIYGLFILILF